MQLDVRMGAAELPQHVRKQTEDAGDTKTNAEESCFTAGRALCECDRCRCFADEMSAAGDE
jgi:hypothetical protein